MQMVMEQILVQFMKCVQGSIGYHAFNQVPMQINIIISKEDMATTLM